MAFILIVTSTDTIVSQTLRTTLAKQFTDEGHSVKCVMGLPAADYRAIPQVIVFDRLNARILAQSRKNWPNATIGIADPKIKTREDRIVAKRADFCLVGSLEHHAAVRFAGGFAIMMRWLPLLPQSAQRHSAQKTSQAITLAYHGNRTHLETFPKPALAGLEDLARQLPLELEVHYRISKVGLWKPPIKFRHFSVRHIEWREPNVWDGVRNSDIGLVPNLIPARSVTHNLNWPKNIGSSSFNRHSRRSDDYQLRFKVTSNGGRIYPFGHFGVPVVADFYPSSAELIRDGTDGLLVFHPLQWVENVQILANDALKRREMGQSLQRRVKEIMDPRANARSVVGSLTDRFGLH